MIEDKNISIHDVKSEHIYASEVEHIYVQDCASKLYKRHV